MQSIGDHPVPTGPLAARWLEWEVPPIQAGALVQLRVVVQNAGLAAWRDVNLAYHWLDERGNPIVWDGLRTPVDAQPNAVLEVAARLRGPIPPGRYLLALDFVCEGRFWFGELGSHTPEREIEVSPRDASGARVFLPAGAEPAPGWDELVRGLHEEGYAAVGGSIEAQSGLRRRPDPGLGPYAPGGGRNPAFPHPLACPSLLPPLEPNAEVAGLPAWRPEYGEPWMFDGRASVRLRLQSGRRPA
ncbi:MAG: hypothetical protein ABR569_07675 [Gaiellaceae bacterium]